MMKSKLYGRMFAATTAMLISAGVAAQDQVPIELPREANMVGLGVFGVPDYYGSSKTDAAVAPIVRWSWDGARYVQLLGPELSLNLSEYREWRAGPLVRVRARRDDDVDDEIVQRMRPVASATEIGVYAAYHMPLDPNRPLQKIVFHADAVGNTNNVYDGVTGNIKATYYHPFQQTMGGRAIVGTIGLGLFFASSSFNDKYFGVNGSDLALFPSLGGQAYEADSGLTSVKIPFTLTTELSKQWLLTVAGRYERLLGDAKDSPVVDQRGDANQWSLGIAAAYRF